MPEIKDINLRSEEVQEILTRVPHWLIRWGNIVVLSIVLLMLGVSWMIKYPDMISTQISITTQVPPQKILAKTSGRIEAILVKDKENVANQVKKIRGDKSPKKINPETTESDAISTSQMSYDNRIANLDTYINQLSSHPQYVPNETEIQVATLQAYHQELATASSQVNAAGNALLTARKNRNEVLYTNENNVIKLMQEVKAYLKSLGDAGTPYYKAFVKLKFKDSK